MRFGKEHWIRSARKPHRCEWCGQIIDAGASYFRVRWFDGNDAGTLRLHTECHRAWGQWSEDMQPDDEWDVRGMRRGCTCDPAGAGCERCAPAAVAP